MNWKQYIKPALIIIACIYLISVIERVVNAPEPQNNVINDYREDKLQMQEDLNYWKNKADRYEILILKNNAHIDTLSSEQLDSVWAAIPWR